MVWVAAIAAFVLLMAPVSGEAASAALGKRVYARCGFCHTIKAGGGVRVGPNLHGVFGRKAGTVAGFPYSTAMRTSGVVWNDKTLSAFLKNPRKFMPGNNMAFPGVKNPEDLANLLAYLHKAAQ